MCHAICSTAYPARHAEEKVPDSTSQWQNDPSRRVCVQRAIWLVDSAGSNKRDGQKSAAPPAEQARILPDFRLQAAAKIWQRITQSARACGGVVVSHTSDTSRTTPRTCGRERAEPGVGSTLQTSTVPIPRQHSVAPPKSAERISATTLKAVVMAAAFFSERCCAKPPVAATRSTQPSMTRTFFSLSLPTVIMTMFRLGGGVVSSARVTSSPFKFSRRLPKSSPSVRQTSHRGASACARPACPSCWRHCRTASKKVVPPSICACRLAIFASTCAPPTPLAVGGTTVSTCAPKPTTPTRSWLRTWSRKMRRMQATQVWNRFKLVPVSWESIERLQSKQKITTFGGPSAAPTPPPPELPPRRAREPVGREIWRDGSAQASMLPPGPPELGGSAGRPNSLASVGNCSGWKPGMRPAASLISRTLIQRRRWHISTTISRTRESCSSSVWRPNSSSQISFTRTPQLYSAADARMRPATSRSPQRMMASTASSDVPPLPGGNGSPNFELRLA
mmetsp:Transcript_131897/g.422315  ORF Transcript_131897/g.422315 Transcript_131897/m.422315 type:complete len:506 (-) Transcript_131897:3076-4593(-)